VIVGGPAFRCGIRAIATDWSSIVNLKTLLKLPLLILDIFAQLRDLTALAAALCNSRTLNRRYRSCNYSSSFQSHRPEVYRKNSCPSSLYAEFIVFGTRENLRNNWLEMGKSTLQNGNWRKRARQSLDSNNTMIRSR
jgi:hypothetical protein